MVEPHYVGEDSGEEEEDEAEERNGGRAGASSDSGSEDEDAEEYARCVGWRVPNGAGAVPILLAFATCSARAPS